MSDVLPKWLHHIDEEDIRKLLESEKEVIRQFAQWMSEPSKVIALQNEITRLAQENLRLRTVMLAAHHEITEHWESYCNDEWYGPQNLVRHLKEGTGFYPGFVDEASKKGGGDVP